MPTVCYLWFQDHTTCPHCSMSGAVANYTDFRGADVLLGSLRGNGSGRSTIESSARQAAEEEGSDSVFDLPVFNLCSCNA